MNNVPRSLGLVVAASVTFARALWTQKRAFLAGERALSRVEYWESSLNATAVGRRRAFHSRTVTSRSLLLLAVVAIAGMALLAPTLAQDSPGGGGTDTPGSGSDYQGPVGVTGIFNGNITTACSYDPLTQSAKRTIDDIVVPGSIGKYPLKMTRYYNSRAQYYALTAIGLGPGWAHEYSWLLWSSGSKVISPQGSTYDSYCGQGLPVGVSEGWEGSHAGGNGTWRRADGGRVVFAGARVISVVDPFGLATTIAYDANGQLVKVTEPGGRCLWFIYGPDTDQDWTKLLTSVEAYDSDGSPGSGTHPTGNRIDWVTYSYAPYWPDVPNGTAQKKMLAVVAYRDGNSATYTYRTDNVTDNPPTSYKIYPVLETCSDVRYSGPMRQIVYEYQNGGPHGAILKEKSPGIGPISTIGLGGGSTSELPYLFTETRGDLITRTFTYTRFMTSHSTDRQTCDDTENNEAWPDRAPQQMLTQYTDFQGHCTYLDYDSNWYVNSVRDARSSGPTDNNYRTTYVRGAPPPQGIGEITQIKHPDGTTINYTYHDATYSDPHYVAKITNERGYSTIYHRDPNNHLRITQIDYPDGGHETFSYNGFGQVLIHQMTNTAYERFAYDGRGLLTDKWNPKLGGIPSDGDPHTHYDYYTSGPWTDRVLTMRLPANGQGLAASETYEYDLDANLNPVAGRGLVTKITHADGYYKSFHYDSYGNKAWEEDELRNRTNYAYDAYNRRISVSEPNQPPTVYDYSPIQGNSAMSYLHTTNSVYFLTDPMQLVITANGYDENFRKTSTTQGYNGSLPATTWFHYDPVGNQDYVTDPRGYTTTTSYDARNRKTMIQAPLNQTTTFIYGDNINVTRINRPDGNSEFKSYDTMNRMTTDTVPKDTGVSLTTTFLYYVSGMLHWVRDPDNHTTWFVYNAANLKTDMIYPDNSDPNNPTDYQHWTWDNAYNLQTRRTVNTTVQSFAYDIRNRQVEMRWPNTVTDYWSDFDYWPDSRLDHARNVNSTVTRYYDADGRMSHEYQTVNGINQLDVHYTYDNDNRLTNITIPNGIYYKSLAYNDPLGRLSTIGDQPNGNPRNTIQYQYDPASNVVERDTLIGSGRLIFQYDNLNRIGSRTIYFGTHQLSLETYGYNSMNELTSVDRAEDTAHDQFGPYLDGELHWIHYGVPDGGSPTGDGGSDGTIASSGWNEPDGTLPAGSSSPAMNDFVPQSDQTNPAYAPDPGFDGAAIADADPGDPPPDGSMTNSGNGPDEPDSTDNSARQVAYGLDPAGNRTQVSDTTNGTVFYTPTILNQYSNVGSDTVTNGNEHEITDYQGVHYVYIFDTHLQTVTSPGGNVYQLAYDALGRCVKRTLTLNNVTSPPTYYIYDGEKPIQEIGLPAWVSTIYGLGIDEPVIRFTHSAVYFFYQDHEGSVTHVIGSDVGNLTEQYRYDVFGAPKIMDRYGHTRSATAIGNRFMFTGREYAGTFGFYEYRARAYHPDLGRFMSEDPKLFDAGDYNLFRYCHNDPEDLTDPMGLLPESAYVGQLTPDRLNNILKQMELAGLSTTYLRAEQSAERQSPAGFWHDRPGSDRLVPMNSVMKGLIVSGLREGGNESGDEINKAVWVDPQTGKLMPSTGSTGSRSFQGGQQGFPPLPPKNSGLLVAADMHSHNFQPGHQTGNERPSGHDFRFGNAALIPVGVRSPTGAIYIYRAPVTANPNSSRMLGTVDGPF